MQRLGQGHHDKRSHPSHTKSIECEACYGKLWVSQDTKSGYCSTCRVVLFADTKVPVGNLYRLPKDTKPDSAAKARSAIEIRKLHRQMFASRIMGIQISVENDVELAV